MRRRLWWLLCLPAAVVLALAVVLSGSAPPARAAAVYTGQAFDACGAPSSSTMQGWLASPFRGIGVYIGGANRACGDGNLSAGWVNAVQSQGWRLAPLYVGLQAPGGCSFAGGVATINPGAAATQGTQAADDAAARASNFGLGAGTPIYFDMEGYNNSSSGCTDPVIIFLNAWTAELHRLGLVSGVYGSSASTILDLATHSSFLGAPNPNSPDDVWFAAWDGRSSVFGDPSFSDAVWSNHQRIHQYRGGHNETWSGATINIDSDFADGALTGTGSSSCQSFSTVFTGSHQVCGAILGKYLALGGPSGLLGFPLTDETPTPDGVGRFNAFSNDGSIYWTPATGAWSIHGKILDKWASMGWERSVLGYPVTDEGTTPNQVGRYNYFSNDGSIYWTPATGAWSIHGKILDKWASMGWESSALGFPTSDETSTPDKVGRFNAFSNDGSIYWTPATGAWSIHGKILDKWATMGWEQGVLGYPTSDETGTPDKVGRFNAFSNDGSIYWTPATGAWSIHGKILDKWATMGWEQGVLGYPTSDETGTPDKVGRFNAFSNHGSIYWTPATGGWSIHGKILDKWATMGWEQGVLGYPTSDETGTPDKVGRFNAFSNHGSIYWTPATAAWSIHGKILDKWATMGWERSCLGYPVSDEESAPVGRQSILQNGVITFSFSSGQASSSC